MKKVFVGMSGGVDSSISAALLKKAGFDVTGVFIKVWLPETDITEGMREFKCTWREDRLDAMRVAAVLEIKFVTLDLETEYKKHVVDYMIAEYKAGRTPNPDVMCNKYVKFGGFFDWAMKQGADYVATGHYAKVVATQIQLAEKTDGAKKNNVPPVYNLVAGDDTNKDQSYFLWTLTQEQLSKTLFPVGNIEKPEVRKLAHKFALPTADKKDSQGLCFIGKIDIKDFLSHYIVAKKGNVLDTAGKIIGTHDGAFFFTVGERHGFTINNADKTPTDLPYYVISKDVVVNTVTVSQHIAEENKQSTITLHEVNWTQGFAPQQHIKSGHNFLARPRYRAPLTPVAISAIDTCARTCIVNFKTPQHTLSAGQSLVIYDGTTCLGGGIISF